MKLVLFKGGILKLVRALCFTIRIVAIVFFAIGYIGYTLTAASGGVRTVPYTATEKVIDAKSGQQVAITQTSVRADGSVMQKLDTPEIFIWNVPDRTESAVDPVTQSFITAPLAERRIPGFLYRHARCEDFFSGGGKRDIFVRCEQSGEKRFNHSLTKVTIRRAFPDGSSVIAIAHAIEDLAWFVVKREQYDKSQTLVNIVEVIDFREGEPIAADFQIPPGYRALANFAEYAKVKGAARGKEPTQQEIDSQNRKWANVVKEAQANGDRRFN